MNRIGLVIALAIAALTGGLFGLWPELDLAIAEFFYSETGFVWSANPWLSLMRDGATVAIGLIVAPAVLAVVRKLVRPRQPLLISGRAIVYLIVTLIVAPLLLANIVLKDHWGRPRPRDVGLFGGTDRFVAWWDPRGVCPENCSFIAGEAAGAFWTMAPASLAPPQWRPLAYAGALAFGTAVGLLRMSFGGHFFTDVIFAGVLTFIIIWIVHGLLYRWRPTLVSDAAVERALERFAIRIRRSLGFRSGDVGVHDAGETVREPRPR